MGERGGACQAGVGSKTLEDAMDRFERYLKKLTK